MFNENTFNSRDDDSAPVALANGLVHLPDHPTVAERAAAIDWILAMARNPRICPPEEIRALAERRRVAQERWRAEDAAEAIEFALPSELRCLSAAKQASAAALAAAGHPEAEALAARLLGEEDALERELVPPAVPTTL